MEAPRGSALDFKKLDAAHALAASTSIHIAMNHLGAATKNLEFGVPCEDCEELRMILTYVDCAANLIAEARKGLKEWPQ